MPSQASAKASGSSLSYTQKVMRTYQVALKCSSFDQRKEINQRIRRSEIQQAKLLTQDNVREAVKLYRSNPSNKFFASALSKKIGKTPNIPQSAFHWLHMAVKNKIELGYDIQLEVVPPYHTSSHHYGCGGVLARSSGQYDIAPCKKCSQKVNTHDNAAKNIASLSGILLTHDTFPSTHVRGSI